MQEPTKIKALSMMQPYAWMIAQGYVVIDDRSWNTNYRGKLAIHASKKFDLRYYTFIAENFRIDLPHPERFDYGGIVAVCDLVACLDPNQPTNVPRQCRSHFAYPGYYGLVLQNVRKTEFLKMSGKPGLFDVYWDNIKLIGGQEK